MSGSSRRVEVMHEVLLAALTGDVGDVAGIFTEDVVGSAPNLAVACLEDVAAAMTGRRGMLSNVALDVRSVDVIGDKLIAEWQVAADHTGVVVFDDGLVIDATNRRIQLAGMLVAVFRGDRIATFRTYFDDLALMEQILADN